MNSLVKSFEEKGYAVLKKVVDENALVQYRGLTEDIISYANKGLEDPFEKFYLKHRPDQGALYDLFQRFPLFRMLGTNVEVLDFLSNIVGEDIFLYENSLVYKPRNTSNEVPWHQDFINRPDEPEKIIAWFALDNVIKENGAMKVIPGSHKKGFLPYHTVKGETHHTRVNIEHVDKEKAEWIELEAGDVLIFHHLLLHSSERVSSVLPRRAYRISYQGFEQIYTPRATPIVVRGGGVKSLMKKYPNQAIEERKSPLTKLVNKIGRKLTRF